MKPNFDGGVAAWAREELLKYEKLLREKDQLLQSGHNATSLEVISLNSRIDKLHEQYLDGAIRGCSGHLRTGFVRFREADNEALEILLQRYERYLAGLTTDRNEVEFATYKRFLEEGIAEIKQLLRVRGGTLSDVDQYVEHVTADIKKRTGIVQRLTEACEADVKAHPDQAEQIRRTYRQAIDALKDAT